MPTTCLQPFCVLRTCRDRARWGFTPLKLMSRASLDTEMPQLCSQRGLVNNSATESPNSPKVEKPAALMVALLPVPLTPLPQLPATHLATLRPSTFLHSHSFLLFSPLSDLISYSTAQLYSGGFPEASMRCFLSTLWHHKYRNTTDSLASNPSTLESVCRRNKVPGQLGHGAGGGGGAGGRQ